MARLAGVALVALAAGSLALAFARERPEASPSPVAVASGAMSSNSLDGQAILSASEIGPGDSAAGQVTVSNDGDGTGELTLVQRLGAEQAGLGGGRLYDRLAPEVTRVAGSGGAASPLLYTGPVSAMGPTPVGRFEPGAAGTYRFVVSFPHGSSDDAAQGASVSLDYEWLAADAPPGPAATAPGRRRSCRYGMAGSPEAQVLTGTARDDRVLGRAGADRIRGRAGPDCIFGGRDDDRLAGEGGDDRVRGGYGDDRLDGGPGDDVLRGRQGDDVVVGGPGSDRLRGTGGNDVIRARDGRLDRVRCGIGDDLAILDSIDLAGGCERIRL